MSQGKPRKEYLERKKREEIEDGTQKTLSKYKCPTCGDELGEFYCPSCDG